MDGEILYGVQEDSQNGMSERVQTLARNIYQEFQRMIQKYDEDVVKDLMPNVVNILECLDLAYTTNQEHEVELELIREDNEQLVTQYEREKQLRKAAETKLLEIEDAREEEQKNLQNKVESLESIVRMLELKAKNASDHVFRLEEKENELRKDYSKLHDRYTELLKVHMDHLERTRVLLGTDRLESIGVIHKPSINPNWNLNLNLSASQMARSTGPLSFGFQSLENGAPSKYFSNPVADLGIMTTPSLNQPRTLHSELNDITTMTDSELAEDHPEETPTLTNGDIKPPPKVAWEDSSTKSADVVKKFDYITNPLVEGKSLKRKEERHGNTLYEELSFQEPSMDDISELVGSWVHPGEFASSDSQDSHDSEPEEALVSNKGKVTDNFYGMGKEVENLIMENNELLATKNALNIVKDDLIAKVDELSSEQEILREEIKSIQAARHRLRIRVEELESEAKHLREELENTHKAAKSDEDEDVPLSQRKRFTRVEMARVLMERNQYKERWMELQEAVRWTEMLRAQKAGQQDEAADRRQRQSVWKFFSNLFSTSSGPDRTEQQPISLLRQSHTAPSLQLLPKGSPGSPRRQANDQIGVQRRKEEGNKPSTSTSVKAHVRRQDGRLQAYGWSLPSKQQAAGGVSNPGQAKSPAPSVGVPVPIYCRPLEEQEPGMKIWCAAGLDLTGGRTAEGKYRVGPSFLYKSPLETNDKDENSIQPLAVEFSGIQSEQADTDEAEWRLSSLVWIVSSVIGKSRITVVDANRPGDVILAFDIQNANALCVASVAGVKSDDFGPPPKTVYSSPPSDGTVPETSGPEDQVTQKLYLVNCSTLENELAKANRAGDPESMGNASGGITYTVQHQYASSVWSDVIKDGLREPPNDAPLTSTAQPTVWIGCQCGRIYVHSAVVHWKKPLAVVKLPDAVLTIIHLRGRVLVALANGQVAIFARNEDGTWNLDSYWLLHLAPPSLAIRCLVRVHSKVWAAYRNCISVINPETLEVETTFEAHPRKESQIRQLCWAGDGVWISIRLDSSIRLFHALNYRHLQDVDIEPYVSKMLGTGKLGFSFVRITSMMISLKRLWMGTGNGVIISVPLTETSGKPLKTQSGPEEESGASAISLPPDPANVENYIPYCSMAQAQLSFHGHKDAVKFFVAVPGEVGIPPDTATEQQIPKLVLVISGGEGYVDFRQEPDESHETASHLIVWQVSLPAAGSSKP